MATVGDDRDVVEPSAELGGSVELPSEKAEKELRTEKESSAPVAEKSEGRRDMRAYVGVVWVGHEY